MSITQSDCYELPDENYFEQSKFNVMPVRNIYIHGHCHEKVAVSMNILSFPMLWKESYEYIIRDLPKELFVYMLHVFWEDSQVESTQTKRTGGWG